MVEPPYTDDETKVGAHLLDGAAQAITIRELSRLTGICERDVKAAVHGLILNHGLKIAGSRQPPYGYYLITCAQELEDAVAPLRRQALQELLRVRALLGPQDQAFRDFMGQLALDVQPKKPAEQERIA